MKKIVLMVFFLAISWAGCRVPVADKVTLGGRSWVCIAVTGSTSNLERIHTSLSAVGIESTCQGSVAYEILVKQADRDKAIKRLRTDQNLKAADIRLTR